MKVRELMERLAELDPETPVMVESRFVSSARARRGEDGEEDLPVNDAEIEVRDLWIPQLTICAVLIALDEEP